MRAGLQKCGSLSLLGGVVLLAGCSAGLAQLGGGIPDVALGFGAKMPVVGGSSSLLEGDPPITTSLSDANFGTDQAQPTRGFLSLASLARTPAGGFILKAGSYELHTQSYCLKAGTHGPGGGDGYLYAPPKGPARDAVVAIVRNSVAHPEIGQHDIQLLLWAIIARAKFEDLAAELKFVASRLLTPQLIATLNRTALDLVPDSAMRSALDRTPAPLRQILEAEARLRQMFASANASFEQIESVAVLAGMAPWGEGSRQVPAGRWSKHPDGYFVRYRPSSYSHTLTQIFVPDRSEAVGKEYDPALHIAVPGNTSRQRLIQSGRAHQP